MDPASIVCLGDLCQLDENPLAFVGWTAQCRIASFGFGRGITRSYTGKISGSERPNLLCCANHQAIVCRTEMVFAKSSRHDREDLHLHTSALGVRLRTPTACLGPPFARLTSPSSSLSASTPVKEVVSASSEAWQWFWRLPRPKTVQCVKMRSDHPARCLPCALAHALVRADALLRLCACTQKWQIVRPFAGSMTGKRICTSSDVSHLALLDP